MLWTFLTLLLAHLVGDFFLQTPWQAANKSKNIQALSRHVMMYSVVIGVAIAPFCSSLDQWGAFVAITFVAHFVTDFCTSRVMSPLFNAALRASMFAREEAPRAWLTFCTMIGIDQALHQIALAMTLWWLL